MHISANEHQNIAAGIAALRGNPSVAEYFQGNGHRMAACRAMIDLLGITPPEWARRGLAGQAAQVRDMMREFSRDNPHSTIAKRT